MPAIYEQLITVPATAIDSNDHVNNVEYLRWMQEVAVSHSSAQGWPDLRYRQLGMVWYVRSHRIDYLAQAFAGDQIRLLTWVVNLQRSRSLRRYRFERVSDGRVLATAETDWVFINLASGRPAPVHAEVAAAFELVPDAPPC